VRILSVTRIPWLRPDGSRTTLTRVVVERADGTAVTFTEEGEPTWEEIKAAVEKAGG